MNPNWLNDQRLNFLSAQKRALLQCWLKDNSRKQQSELIASVFSFNALLKEKKLSFTEKEKNILWDIILDYMTPQEKQNLQIIKEFMKK